MKIVLGTLLLFSALVELYILYSIDLNEQIKQQGYEEYKNGIVMTILDATLKVLSAITLLLI
jgi:hypothetical protein